jgi:amino acid adenylation domain-containing protein
MTITIQGFRLSPQQKHLWLLQADSSVYKAQAAIAIQGNLQPEILKTALQKVVAKHEILRTSFRYLEEMKIPVMVVEDNSDILWEEIDLCNSDEREQQNTIDLLFVKSRKYQFNLEKGNNLAVSLIKLSIDKHILILCLPALCADTWTLNNLVKEIGQAYANDEFISSEETVQYIQFAEWQNQLLEDEESEPGKYYWQKQDCSAIYNLNLPFERKNSTKQNFELESSRGKWPYVFGTGYANALTDMSYYSVAIASDTTAKLEQLIQKHNISLEVLLLTCWQVLLWKQTNQSEIIIGKTFDNREYEELHDALGLFLKYLPIKYKLNATLSFQEILEKVQNAILEAEEWQDYFEPEINFPIGFDFVKHPQKYLIKYVSFELDRHFICSEPFKIKLTCIQKHDGLITQFDYDTNYFAREDIQRLARQFQTLLTSVIENPIIAIADLELLNASDREQLLIEWNDTQTKFPNDKCIHQIFEKQVQQTPNNIAIVFEEERLTYEELNRKANQLARYLQSLGVGAEKIIGIALERSLDTIVSILGILKAGGAYLVLDLSLPKEVLAMRSQDAEISVILTQQTLIERLPESKACLVCFDKDREIISKQEATNPNALVKSDNLVYIIFTSGSTGKPKGVAIEHRQLVNYLYGIQDKLALPTGASYATVSTFAADLGNTAIFPALCTGSCLHVISQQRTTDAEALADYFQRHAIDCLKIVPSHLAALMASVDAKAILPNQLLVLGGETANWDLIEQIQQQSSCRILNHYGPTETTVGVLTYPVKERSIADTVPLGRPLANIQVYVLCDRLQPVPIGVSGELYIAGSGLARGYLNAPQLTQERFVDNPFHPGAKLYKTGDLARYLPDGNIEFLGRSDRQIKIRGFRIELEEIEAVLCQHPRVQQAVVVVKEEQRLIAYVVFKQAQNTLVEELRRFLPEKLPEYMVPSAFIALKALPLTANGKIDRDALPDRDELSNNFASPRNPVEEVIASIWAEILNLKQVGIYDDFFALGGHSLLATQVISRLRKAFKVDLSLRQLFEMPTVVELAKQIETAMKAGENLEVPAIVRRDRDREFPLSFAQQRLWFLEQLNRGSSAYNLSRAIRFSGKLNVAALIDSFNEIVLRHEALRTNFISQQGKPFQKIRSPFKLSLPVVDLQHLTESAREVELQRLAAQEAREGFDLASDPLLRLTLLRLSQEEHVLLFTMHHIVSDGWSTGILVREVAALYEAFSGGQPSPLPELHIQYADFALWQQNWLQGQVLETQLAYWRKQLNDPSVLDLPTRSRPAVQSLQGATQSILISKTLAESIKALSQKQGVTLFMTLLAAFKTLLYRYTSQEDILVGSPIANRNREEIENLIGFFINNLVLRTKLSGNLSFLELLQRVREITLEAYTHQDLPFEKLVSELQLERDTSRAPLFQVMFVLENAPMPPLELPGLTLQPIDSETGATKFDLTLYLVDTEEGLTASLEYSTDLFEKSAIARMLEHFQILLSSIVDTPERSIATLPILTQAEREQLLVEFNNPNFDPPLPPLKRGESKIEQCIHQLFETQVARSPDAIAVRFESEQITYRELNAKANQLAYYLQKLGVKPETLVGVCLERSPQTIIALLGILKAGGAYVPLDPNSPPERLAFMLQDSQVPILLTRQNLVAIPECEAKIVYLDKDRDAIAKGKQDNPVNRTTLDNALYAIYTSGSTGTPKAVLGLHRGAINRFDWMWQTYPFIAGEICCQKTSLGFVDSVWEIFGALLQGIPIAIIPDKIVKDPPKLIANLANYKITRIVLVPSLLRAILDIDINLQEQLPHLNLWVTSGEAISLELWQRFQQAMPNSTLLNLYGSSEVSADVTCCDLSQQDSDVRSKNTTTDVCLGRTPCAPTLTFPYSSSVEQLKRNDVSIGRAIANTQVYLLDDNLQPVPIGVRGQVYIGGENLARGYLYRCDRTAETFIPNPFSDVPGARLYWSGDIARFSNDGNLEYLGRIDNQVKIRGNRIELGEIEAALVKYREVKEAVVSIQKQQIVAYLVSHPETQVNLGDLRRFLQAKLPEYAIPNAFVFRERLPLLPNGKVNRRALPAPDSERSERENVFVAPQSPTEIELAQIWSSVLGVDRVGIEDNFFALGGHSLLATQVMSRIGNSFGVELSLQDLFVTPTICSLAQKVEEAILLNADSVNLDAILDRLEQFEEEEIENLSAFDGEREKGKG